MLLTLKKKLSNFENNYIIFDKEHALLLKKACYKKY